MSELRATDYSDCPVCKGKGVAIQINSIGMSWDGVCRTCGGGIFPDTRESIAETQPKPPAMEADKGEVE